MGERRSLEEIYPKRGLGHTALAPLSEKGPEAGKATSHLCPQRDMAAAGWDPSSPDRAGTLQACLRPPARRGSLEAKQGPDLGGLESPGDSCQARAAAGDRGPGTRPSPSLLHLPSAPSVFLDKPISTSLLASASRQTGQGEEGKGRQMWQRGHWAGPGCPLPSPGAAQATGPYIPTVAATVPRWSHQPCPRGRVQNLNPDPDQAVTQGLGQPRLSGRGKLARLAWGPRAVKRPLPFGTRTGWGQHGQ